MVYQFSMPENVNAKIKIKLLAKRKVKVYYFEVHKNRRHKMTTKEVIKYFGTAKAVGRFLDIEPAAVRLWGERPPKGRQFELELRTGGALKADTDLLPAYISEV